MFALEDFEIIQRLGDIDGVSMFACLHYDDNMYLLRSYSNNSKNIEKSQFLKNIQKWDFSPKIFTTFKDGDIEYIVTEYVVGTDLEQWRKSNNDPEVIDSIFQQLCNMFLQLQNEGYSNLNLSFRNILVTPTNNIKFMDFSNTDFRCVPLKKDSIGYWSLGILLFYTITGELPYESRNEKVLNLKMSSSKIKYKKYNINHKYLETIKNLLKKNPEKRSLKF